MAGRFGVYQIALLLLIGGCMVAYAALWRVAAAETLASMSAVAAGASIALLVAQTRLQRGNVIAVFNPLEKMITFADTTTTNAANGSSLSAILLLLLDGLGSVLARYTFVLHSSPRPTVFLTWLIIPGIVYAWRRGEKQAALQALALMLAAIGIDALGVRRGLKSEYFIFTDPLIILAGAILLDAMRRAALGQMDLCDRHDAVWPAYRDRTGRTRQVRLQAHRPGIDLRMESALHAADAAALVQAPP